MADTHRASGRDLTAFPRAVLSAAVGAVHMVERAVLGEERMRTSRGNAWEAVCADRARAREQVEMGRLVAALVAAHPSVGSSPRSRASQT